MSLEALAELATGRSRTLCAEDLDSRHEELSRLLGGSRVLIVGAAGSIGSATAHVLAQFRPLALHLVDLNENALAELVRDFRGAGWLDVSDLRALPLDYGAPVMQQFLRENGPYDFVLNFAALKHVRSEKDLYSLTQMLDTNVVKQVRFLSWLTEGGWAKRYFCVSTDKAANPVNLMGASKRIMEHLIFSGLYLKGVQPAVSSARFANVAFSNGSLLQSFLTRFERKQPLAVPRETRRYFISLEESGHICLLAAVLGKHRHILIPRLKPTVDLHDLQSIAIQFLRRHSFIPRVYEDERAALANIQADLIKGEYPLLLTPLDTSGEKPHEEFFSRGETPIDDGFQSLLGIFYKDTSADLLKEFVGRVESLVVSGGAGTAKGDIVKWFTKAIPELEHIETGKSLDQRM
jgi:FlaA1/EpsC-like NDP-sugar epimerase